MTGFRVLVVADDPAVQEALLSGLDPSAGSADESFDVAPTACSEATTRMREAVAAGRPFQVAFLAAARLAPALRQVDPSIQLVLAGDGDGGDEDLIVLREPFTRTAVRPLARTLCRSWVTRDRLHAVTSDLERRVEERTAELGARAAQQEALAEIAARFVELSAEDDPADAIQWSLARIGKLCRADAAAVIQAGDRRLLVTHAWRALGVPDRLETIQEVPPAGLGPLLDRLRRDRTVAFSRPEELPGAPAGLVSALQGHLEAGLLVPVVLEGRFAGTVLVASVRDGRSFSGRAELVLRTAGHIVFRALQARRAAETLATSRGLLEVGRKDLARALEASEARFEALLRRSPAPTVLLDAEGLTVVDVNDAFLGLLGRSRAATLGRTTAELGLLGGAASPLTLTVEPIPGGDRPRLIGFLQRQEIPSPGPR